MNSDDRSPLARAMGLVHRIIASSLMLALPAVGGIWLDRRLETFPLLLILGVVLGVLSAGWNFYSLIVALSEDESK